MPASGYARLREPLSTAPVSALQALTLLIEQRLILEVAPYADEVDLRVLPPLCPLAASSGDFRHAGNLIARAQAGASRWLARGEGSRTRPERFLSLHAHRRTGHDGCAA